jgi:hypothetical protein
MKTKKHTALGYKSGFALRKLTGKSLIDWVHLTKRFPLYKSIIKAHRSDQNYLIALKEKLERVT